MGTEGRCYGKRSAERELCCLVGAEVEGFLELKAGTVGPFLFLDVYSATA